MGQDCVVLTSSSSRDLDEARKDLAGRRGNATRSDRLLLSMSFRAFCRQMNSQQPLPQVPVIRAADFLGREREDAVQEMIPWLDDLASLWEVYCRCGGLPSAVAGHLDPEVGGVAPEFVEALLYVIHGEALRRGNLTATQCLFLLHELSKSVSSFVAMTDLARDAGIGERRQPDDESRT